MANHENQYSAQPFDYIGWSGEDVLTLTGYALLESFPGWRDEDCLLGYVTEIRRVREKIPPADVGGFLFSEESVTLLGIFVHTRSIPKEGLHKLLF
jgi:hypothetical protein